MEQWKDVVGFEGLYQVSDHGRVRTLPKKVATGRVQPQRIMKLQQTRKGYIVVPLCKETNRYSRQVHRLVAEAFIPNPDNKTTVNHKNNIKSDNRVTNLEWATLSENLKHAFDNGYRNVNYLKKPIRCSNGMIFESSYQAAEWLSKQRHFTTTVVNLAKKIRKSTGSNGYHSAYGYRWYHIS